MMLNKDSGSITFIVMNVVVIDYANSVIQYRTPVGECT